MVSSLVERMDNLSQSRRLHFRTNSFSVCVAKIANVPSSIIIASRGKLGSKLTAHHDEIVIILGRFHGLESLAQQRDLLLGEYERVQQAHEREKLRPRAHLREARPQIRIRADRRDGQVVRHSRRHVREEKRELFRSSGVKIGNDRVRLFAVNCQKIVAAC